MNYRKSDLGIAASLEKRKQFVELILVAAVLAFGINLSTSCITADTAPSIWLIVASVVLTISPILFLTIKIFVSRSVATTVEMVIVIDRAKNDIKQIPLYLFSEELARATNAVFVENESIRDAWDEEPLFSGVQNSRKICSFDGANGVKYFAVLEPSEKAEPAFRKATPILIDGIEFVLLQSLSNHLAEHFKKFSQQDSNLKTVTGNEVPEILSRNRFMRHLSADWEERQIFRGSNIPAVEGSEISYIAGTNGANYSQFKLTLPAGSNISRPANGSLCLDSERFQLSFKVRFSGRNTMLPRGFANGYLGVSEKQISVFKASIEVALFVKLAAMFKVAKWNYFDWVDGFFDRLDRDYNFNTYLNSINWISVATAATVKSMSGNGSITRQPPAELPSEKPEVSGPPVSGKDVSTPLAANDSPNDTPVKSNPTAQTLG